MYRILWEQDFEEDAAQSEMKEIKKDECIVCGTETEYDTDTHIDYRDYYIEGAGQLCHKCGEIYFE